MKYRHHLLTIFSLAVLLSSSQPTFGGSLRTSGGRAMPQAAHGTAYAALQPVGAATGWGRVVVRDDDLPSGPKRTVQVWLFGMEPRTDYLVTIDGVDIGSILTRSSGNGVLKLQNDGRGHEPVPEELPSIDELQSVVIYGPGLAPTLEGSFSSLVRPGGETTYEESIELDDVSGGEAEGMAKVEMKEGGHQEFKTCATGLMPNSIYEVIVDGVTVATVTADDQGQACVKLEEPDDENPLPPELSPVSEIVSVQWWDSAENLILSGAFTGIGSCAHLKGTVTGFTATGFTLETPDETVTVVVTAETEWEEFGVHELALGDKVKVEGCWDDDDFVAEAIELLNRDDHEDGCAKLVGIIGNVSGENFVLDTDQGSLPVVTTGETEWLNFGDHQLAIGDKVKVEGCWEDDVFVAQVVELKNGGNHEEPCASLVGVVGELTAEGFMMETESGSVAVVTTDATEWEGFGDQGITVADKVKVEGCWDGEVFVADEVELKSRDDPGEKCGNLMGVVTEVSLPSFMMQKGNKTIQVLTTIETEWEEFGDHGIAVGDKVKVAGCWSDEVFVAEEVELKKQG